MSLEIMLRVYSLQNGYALSNPISEETLCDRSEAMRLFSGIELSDDRIPDERTILNFRHPLEWQGLTETLFAEVNASLAEKGIRLRSRTRPRSVPTRAMSALSARRRSRRRAKIWGVIARRRRARCGDVRRQKWAGPERMFRDVVAAAARRPIADAPPRRSDGFIGLICSST